ncbi:MAG TPA: sterol desaturase family protein [Phototrophicaceae bacterium]|nr:sterol desaturase family protein [Phototrophicaceae bacterium]
MSAPVSWEVFFGFFIFALVFAPLERRFPIRRQRAFRAGWTTDVIYYVVGCFVGHLSDATSLGIMLIIRKQIGMNSSGVASTQPGWVQFLEILLIADFLAYLYHRALHRNAYLWRLHRVHHSPQQMDWLANVRLHPLDKLGGDCFQFIPIFFLGFADAPLLTYTIFLGFQGFLNHSNIRLNFGPLRWVIASPQFHHWHHCDDPKAHNKNFAPHLVIFDLLFGTAYLPPDASMPDKYGIPDPVPEGFWPQMIYPLQRVAHGTDAEEAGRLTEDQAH